MKVFYGKDADLSIVQGCTVAIIGYGSQGHAHANNLKDSGVSVMVGLRAGSASEAEAREAGIKIAGIGEATAASGPESSRPRSATRPRPTCSANRPCSAAA